ncbi:MAG: protein kinase, partial [Gemmatimonadota bacterium]|nr:protein kinase [Gemmatimonadota bacterium]
LTAGAASVMDLGIAHAIHESRSDAEDPGLTRVGTSLGTPRYMAPEQACGDAVDARTDVYSWGVMAYEMISGQHPFPTAHTVQRLIAAQIAERPAPLIAHTATAPGWICGLVMTCLAKEPALRPADGAALVHAVEYGEAGQAREGILGPVLRRMFGKA